jgi:hypothetical protein
MKRLTSILAVLLIATSLTAAPRAAQYRAWLLANGHDVKAVKFKGSYSEATGAVDSIVTDTWPEAVAIPAEGDLLPWAEAKAALAAAKQAAEAADPSSTVNAFMTLAQKLAVSGYTPVPTKPSDLIGGLPPIVNFIQGKLDAKDAQLAAKQAEIVAHAEANQFKLAFEDQILWNNLIRQRCQLQDGHNEIQSWALALIIRQGAGK